MSTADQSDQEVTDELVRMSHGDIDRVRELVDLHPGLAHATGAHGIPVPFFAAMAGRRWLNGSSQTAQRSTSLATMARRRWPWLSIEVITTWLSYCANTEVKIRVDRSTDHRPTG